MSLKRWLFIAALLFALGFSLGLVTPAGTAAFFFEDIKALEEFSPLLKPFQVSTVIFIFLKNTSALVISFFLSPIFLLLPLLSLVLNGWLLAFVATLVTRQESVLFVLAAILPHGIIEIPALILGAAAALRFGTAIILVLLRKRTRDQTRTSLRQNLKYLTIAITLLVPAAIIEAFVTPLLIR